MRRERIVERMARIHWGAALGAWAMIAGCGGGGDEASEPGGSDPPATSPPPAGAPTSAPAPEGPPSDPARATPPPIPGYSGGACPTLVGGATKATSLNSGFKSGKHTRGFHLIVPPSYDGTKAWPVFFAWHWLNASARSFIDQGELESATEQMKFIAVVPEELRDGSNKKAYQMDWPFVETWGAADELLFIDDMLSCVNAQYAIDPARVYGVGVSAGALWATYVSTTEHANRFAGIESLSGGLGADPVGVWKMKYVPQANKFPALVLWGGSQDVLAVDFAKSSMSYRDELRKDSHFVVQCIHDAGHAIPPVDPPANGTTRFAVLWQFMLDHPYGLAPGDSPYKTKGLPAVFPSWCKVVP
ncbi:MAG: hypothetical protein KF819_34420 [Labilithrix sp.]|nr:hypothetical protein [Labilithrix sp.]